MTGDMPRTSTRLSSREPTRKRRRAPPPLSVTNVFADARLPDTAHELWRWPVTSWYFGDVGQADLQLAADRPFVRSGSSLPPVGKHYRLRWLEEDATNLVEGVEQPLPEPLPLLPYARQKDTTACARRSRGPATDSERNAPGRPRKRQCVPKEPALVEPASIGLWNQNGVLNRPEHALVARSYPLPSLHASPGPSVATPTAPKVEPSEAVAKSAQVSVAVKPQNVSERKPKTFPAPNFCTPSLSVPSLAVASPSETIACVKSQADTFTPSPSAQNDGAKQSIPNNGNGVQDDDDKSEDDSREEVLLQFVSPAEPRLMGTLTYSLPINPAPEKDAKEILVDDPPLEVKHPRFGEEGIRVEDLDLEFRKSTRPFDDAFHDIDNRDDLRPEILRLNTVLNGLVPKTKPLRNASYGAVQAEIQRQSKVVEMDSEEKRIMERLKEIEKEKAAAMAAKKAALAKAKAAERRESGRMGTQGRQRRRSRKIQVEPDSDDDNDGADHDELKIVSGSVVIVDNPVPSTVNGHVVPERKLLVKPEAEKAAPVTLDGLRKGQAAGNRPEAEGAVDLTLGENTAPRSEESNAPKNIDASAKPEVVNGPNTPPEVDSTMKPNVASDDSKALLTFAVESMERKSVEFGLADAPVPAVVSPDCVMQLGLDRERNELPIAALFPVKSEEPPIDVFDSKTSGDKVRAALAELTNVDAKSPLEGLLKPKSAGLLGVVTKGPDTAFLPIEGTRDIFQSPQGKLTPLEPEAEVTTTPFTEIDIDATPDSDDESKPKETGDNDETEREEQKPSDSGKMSPFDPDNHSVPTLKEDNSPCTIFPKDGKEAEQLVRMPSPVSPLQAATPTCGFVVVPATGPAKVLTSGSALVNHMKAIHADTKKEDSMQSGS